MLEDIRKENAKMNKLKIKTITKTYILGDGRKSSKGQKYMKNLLSQKKNVKHAWL